MDIDWIRDGLRRRGKSQRGLARALGVDPAAVSRLLAGGRQLKAAEIPLVAGYLGLDIPAPFAPAPAAAETPTSAAEAAPMAYAPSSMQGPRDLPVYGTVVAGEDGMFLMNGEVHDYVERPPSLQGVSSAYAVYVADTSMVPRYFPGETLHIHPGRPVHPGDNTFVVVQIRPDVEGEPPRALVKQFIRRSGSKLILKQYNPEKQLEFDMDDILSMHLIIWGGRG